MAREIYWFPGRGWRVLYTVTDVWLTKFLATPEEVGMAIVRDDVQTEEFWARTPIPKKRSLSPADLVANYEWGIRRAHHVRSEVESGKVVEYPVDDEYGSEDPANCL